MANKAILLQLGVFLADNNVRRNIANYGVNAQSSDGSVVQTDTNVLPTGGVYTFTALATNGLTIIKTTKPLTAEVDQGSTTYTTQINSIFVVSDAIQGIVFTNDGDDPAQLSITQI